LGYKQLTSFIRRRSSNKYQLNLVVSHAFVDVKVANPASTMRTSYFMRSPFIGILQLTSQRGDELALLRGSIHPPHVPGASRLSAEQCFDDSYSAIKRAGNIILATKYK